MSLNRTPMDNLSVADQINALARRHLDIAFKQGASCKNEPAITLAAQPNADGKYCLTFGSAAVAEVERCYPTVADGRHYIRNNLGDAMVLFGDYLNRPGVTTKELHRVLRAAENQRLEERSAALCTPRTGGATPA